MSRTTAGSVGASTLQSWRRARILSADDHQPRARRASDLLVLLTAGLALLLLSLSADPPAGFEKALRSFFDAVPEGLDPVWQLIIDIAIVWTAFLAVVALVRRRWSVLVDVVLGALLATGIAVLVGHAVVGGWPGGGAYTETVPDVPWFPSVRLTILVAALATASPHLTRPGRRVGQWLIFPLVISTALIDGSTPAAALAGWLAGLVAAAAVHLALGSSSGRPALGDVSVALRELGIEVQSLGIADRQPSGSFVVDAVDADGHDLVVKVFGRDAHDTQLTSSAWRALWYRDPGTPLSFHRLTQVEHEAFLTLLAARAGIRTQSVITAGATAADDVVLVMRAIDPPLAAQPHSWTTDSAADVWALVDRLHEAGTAHGQIDDHHVVPLDDGFGIIDFRGGAVAPSEIRLRTDDAQTLVTTALQDGIPAALDAATVAIGTDRLGELLPFVQQSALTPRQRALVKAESLDLDELREQGAERLGITEVELQKLRRVTGGSVLQVGLLLIAFFALAAAFGDVDWDVLVDQIGDATIWLVVLGFLVAQLPRFPQALSTLGASPNPVPLGPLYALQLASSYIGLAIPSSAARVAVNIRFFQRHGTPPGTAMAIGALDGFCGFLVQILILTSILVLTPFSLDIDLDSATPSGLGVLVLILIGLAVLSVVVVLVVRPWREWVFGWIKRLVREAGAALKGLHSPRRLLLLFGGNFMSEVFFATALGLFVRSLGYDLGLVELLLINVSVSLFTGFIPVPGGIGVMEGGLTYMLTRAGVPQETALASVLMYRLSTFYLPPIWGFFAFSWLERNKHL